MAYATVEELQKGFRTLDDDEKEIAEALLDEADIIIDSYNEDASDDIKKLVECRMVRRSIGDGSDVSTFPLGSTQGSMSAGGYTQSWTLSNGSSGELYISRMEKGLLGKGKKRIGSYSPTEELIGS